MIVCHCKAVTDRTIRSLLRKGVCSLSEVCRASEAGRSCGGCIQTIDQLVMSEKDPSKPVTGLAPAR